MPEDKTTMDDFFRNAIDQNDPGENDKPVRPQRHGHAIEPGKQGQKDPHRRADEQGDDKGPNLRARFEELLNQVTALEKEKSALGTEILGLKNSIYTNNEIIRKQNHVIILY